MARLSGRLKRNRWVIALAGSAGIASTFFGLIGGADKAATAIHHIHDIFFPAAKVKLAQFALASETYRESTETLLAKESANPPEVRTFEPISSCEQKRGRGPACHATFQVSIQNLVTHEIAVTGIRYNVENVGRLAGLGAGPLLPTATYSAVLEFREGTQTQTLVPPFVIPGNSAGAFLLEISRKDQDTASVGAWWMHIEFVSTDGSVMTEQFQLFR